MHRKLPISWVFLLAGVNHSSDAVPARESAGGPQATRKSCGLCPKGGRPPRFPRGCHRVPSKGLLFIAIRWPCKAAFAARRWALSLRKASGAVAHHGLSAGASTLPARDGCTDWAAGSFGIPGPPKSSRVFGPIARVRQAGSVSIGACPVRCLARPRRTGRRREARPQGCGAGAPPEASRVAVPPSEVGLRFLRGPASAPLPLSGSPGPIAGALRSIVPPLSLAGAGLLVPEASGLHPPPGCR